MAIWILILPKALSALKNTCMFLDKWIMFECFVSIRNVIILNIPSIIKIALFVQKHALGNLFMLVHVHPH